MDIDELNCPVCQERYNNDSVPRTLACGHTYCSICLHHLVKNDPLCPECRKPIKEKSVDNFPVSYTILRLAASCDNSKSTENNIIETKENKDEKNIRKVNFDLSSSAGSCDVHGGDQKFFRCMKCNEWLCGTCVYINHNDDKCNVISAHKAFQIIKEKHQKRILMEMSNLQNSRSDIKTHIDKLSKEIKVIKYNQELLYKLLKDGEFEQQEIMSEKLGLSLIMEEHDRWFQILQKQNKQIERVPVIKEGNIILNKSTRCIEKAQEYQSLQSTCSSLGTDGRNIRGGPSNTRQQNYPSFQRQVIRHVLCHGFVLY